LAISLLVFLPACGGGGGSDTTGFLIPGEFAYYNTGGGGNLSMVSRGGQGLTGNGGAGGEFYLYAYSSGDILVTPNGTVDTTYTIPDVRPELGINPRSVTANETIQPDTTTNQILGDDGLTPATGLWVAPGVTLTLMPNNDQFGGGVYSRIYMIFEDGVIVEGALDAEPGDLAAFDDGLGNYTANLLIVADNFWMSASGSIDTSGAAALMGDGAAGGDVDIDVDGNVVAYGPVDTRGGDGETAGGAGGSVNYESNDYGAYNLGAIDTSGGDATGAPLVTGVVEIGAVGGAAGDIEIYSDYGAAVNKGMLTAIGGNGTNGGGAGGDVNIESEEIGMLVNAADIYTRGGNATSAGPGGSGGDIYLESCSGTLRATGSFDSRGGNGLGAEGNGGAGGDITFYIDDCDYIYDEYVVGGMYVGCSLDASGGDGANGGDGGDLNFEPDQDEVYKPGLQVTVICGSPVIDVRGGDGAVNGGSGASNEIYNDGAYDYNGTEFLHDIRMEVDLIARGGNGQTGAGGNGGSMDIYQDDETYGPDYDRIVRNTGNFDLRGGNGATTGGNGGYFFMFDHYYCMNEGDIDNSGGSGGTGPGGFGGEIEVLADDLVSCAGMLTSNGGASQSGLGGNAGDISVEGRFTSCSGTYTARGGASATDTGGNGGTVDVYGTERRSTVSGTGDVSEGTGAVADGLEGEIWVDGTKLPLTGGTATIQ
jgi:hypothetical protein